MNRTFRSLFTAILALTLVFSLAACGRDETTADPNTTGGSGELGLADWYFRTATWSSPNGATVEFTTVPLSHSKDQTATLVVRMEGEDVESVPCEWDGKQYTASVDLNAADGYCYYVILTQGSDQKEIPVNTPTEPRDLTILDLATALESNCELAVEDSSFQNGTLSITTGTARVQAPRILDKATEITCTQVLLSLTSNGEGVATAQVPLGEKDETGMYTLDLAGVSFQVPNSEDDQHLVLEMYADLSNGQTLSATGSSWLCTGDTATQLTVG